MDRTLFLVAFLPFALANAERMGESPRAPRLLPVFQIVSFPNQVCVGSTTRNGTCFTAAECASKGGSKIGTCASGFGVCCIFSLSCGGQTSQNCSYLAQTSITRAPSVDPCTYTICRTNANICRIRLDFTTFNIAGPMVGTVIDGTANTVIATGGGIGDCVTDTFSLSSPGNVGSPIICGFNTGQHMIVDASDACSVATFDIGSSGDTRQWDIKVTQYACGNERGGPDGCLQYFTGVSGRVSSFNFPTTSSTIGSTATHLSSQCYTMCFRQEVGRCSICFTTSVTSAIATNLAASQTSFGLSVSGAAIATASQDGNCNADFLLIPGAETLPLTGFATRERLCGRVFTNVNGGAVTGASVCTSVRPFRIQFKSDANEATIANAGTANTNELAVAPGGIVGFSLNYVQQSC